MPRAALLLALFAPLACQDPVSPAAVVATSSPLMARSAPEMFNERIPLSFDAAGCSGEMVSLSGELHSVTKVWNTAEELRVMSHLNVNIAGIGQSTGLQYRWQQITNSDLELTWSTGDGVAHQVFQLKLIGQGALSDWRLTMHGTYVYENGGVRLIPQRWESVCT